MVAPYRGAGGLPFRPRRSPEFRGIDLATQPVPPEPHPELTAETRLRHLWLVESAVWFCGTDAAAISAAVVIPEWNVRRALHELGLGMLPSPNPGAGRGRPEGSRQAADAAAWLAAHGRPATAEEVAAGCGIADPGNAAKLLNRHPDRFRRAGETRVGKARFILWAAA